jgi:hypothetical protein
MTQCFRSGGARIKLGMQAREELELADKEKAIKLWLEARDQMIAKAEEMSALGVHKQIVNRLTEPWMFITVLLTATEFDNWWALRCHPDAQPEIKWVADDMFRQYENGHPGRLNAGEWHLPLITWDDEMAGLSLDDLKKISTGRCARVSYLTHDGRRDHLEDIKLHDRLLESNHWSPFEHCAQALDKPEWVGNFVGWKQYRKFFKQEHVGGSLEDQYDLYKTISEING